MSKRRLRIGQKQVTKLSKGGFKSVEKEVTKVSKGGYKKYRKHITGVSKGGYKCQKEVREASRGVYRSEVGVDILRVVSPTIRCVPSCWRDWRACIGPGMVDRGPGRNIPPTPGCRTPGIGHRGPS